MSKGISWTGDKTKDFIQTSAENYNLKNPANQTPTQISTGVQKTVQYVSTGSKYVAKGTGAVASAIGLHPKFFKSLFNRLTLTRPLCRKLRIRADSSLIRQKIGTFLYKMMLLKVC